MNTYSYWMPGNQRGQVEAATDHEAAQKVLDSGIVYFISGDASNGNLYVDNYRNKTCKIWPLLQQEA